MEGHMCSIYCALGGVGECREHSSLLKLVWVVEHVGDWVEKREQY
jgi:hypothetical protein